MTSTKNDVLDSVPSGATERLLIPDTWACSGFAERRFVGFTSLVSLDLAGVPKDPGVYVVLRQAASSPRFLEARMKNHPDAAAPYSVADLAKHWVPGSQLVYVGKGDDLRYRLRLYIRYGQARVANHDGGRSIWQLADSAALIVAWRTISDLPQIRDAQDAEKHLLRPFMNDHGRKLPFANRRL
ncbi:hypothetical protein [Luteococcus japonicus]|uniref:hypothetical protein n=1 Tax=Luteococcus japonicus TaxID=33984 RepID=UPI0011815828|nr:hypothetical protein [Luteococcus japonicus]